MKQYIRHIIYLLVVAVCLITAPSCQDDTFRGLYPEEDGNGLEVSFTVNLPPLAAASLSSRGSAGDLIKQFDNPHIHIYVYNADGTTLIYDCGKDGLENYKYDPKGNTKHPSYPYGEDKDYDTSEGETTTPKATFKLKASPFKTGETYKIYVTANVDVPSSEYATADKLKAYKVKWDTENIGANAQMFGMFAKSDENVPGEAVTFANATAYNLHAWLVRCASKVTISYNTSELNENTWIYLHNVKIHNVPQYCHLGDGNTATKDYGVVDEGESIVYAPSGSTYDNAEAEFSTWPTLSHGTEEYGSDHSETAEALYFYENLQGSGKDKGQVDSGKPDTPEGEVSWPDGVNEGNYGWRDEKPYGTYIEVEAYYRSTAKGNEGRGKIIYRFMLGMDTFKDYNAYRNHHFKLTLNFRGNANDVDWHIDYRPETNNPIYVPEPFYISYLYGENVEIPITVNGKLTKGTKVITEIVENNWKPKDAPSSMYWTGPVQSSTGIQYEGPWHGFLSLRPTNSIENNVTNEDNITNADGLGRERDGITERDIADNKKAYLMSYWYGGSENIYDTGTIPRSELYSSAEIDANEKMHVPMQGYREFDTSIRNGRTYDQTKDNPDSYEIMEVDNNGKTKTHLYLPLYTRALFMVKTLGYSGANPYFQYQRKAVVKITCWVDEVVDNQVVSKKYSKLCDVIQVRRIINPAGIYRAEGDNKSFTVTLSFRTSEHATTFMPFASEGKWSAEIESGDPGFITLNGLQKIQGRTGEYVKFQVHFIPSAIKKKNRYAVILVKYHDYTCKHRIMVRQGYEPDAILNGGVKWHCFNLRGGEYEAESPLDGGSMFRFGNLDYAIDARENNTEQFGLNQSAHLFTVVGRDGKILKDKVKWYRVGEPNLYSEKPNLAFQPYPDLDSDTLNFRKPIQLKDAKGEVIDKNKSSRLPSYDDWTSVRENPHILYTFGICYDGNSTTTSMTADNALSYKYYNDDNSNRGMRGCFVFNKENARNIFLPVGSSGYGRRKHGKTSSSNIDISGTLRYANRSVYMPLGAVEKMPMFWNIKDNLGAIYWGKPSKIDKKDVWNKDPLTSFSAWDINVSTYDFNQFATNALPVEYKTDDNKNNIGIPGDGNMYYSDAAYIRLVDDP